MDQRYESVIEDWLDPLAEYERLFQTVFERSDEGIFVSEPDIDGRIIEANPAAAMMHGYNVGEMATLKMSDLHAKQELSDAEKIIKRVLEGEWVEIEHEHVRKDGSKFPVRYRVGRIQYLGRRVIISFVQDITTEKRLEQSLKQCESKLATRI